MIWMPWVHWWWKPYSEETATDKTFRWLCLELHWKFVYISVKPTGSISIMSDTSSGIEPPFNGSSGV